MKKPYRTIMPPHSVGALSLEAAAEAVRIVSQRKNSVSRYYNPVTHGFDLPPKKRRAATGTRATRAKSMKE